MQVESRFDLGPFLPAAARELDPDRESREAWARFHAFRVALHREAQPEDPPEPDAVAEAGIRREEPFYEQRRLVLEREGEVVSALFMSAVRPGTPEYESNRHHVWVNLQVLPGHRRQGLASGWLPSVAAFAESRGARLLSGDSELAPGHAFAERLGAEARFRAYESRLWLDRAPWDRIREWAAIDPAPSRLERYEPFVPEAVWADYARGYTELERHVPREGFDIGDWILTPDRMRIHRERLAAQRKTLHVLAAWDAEGLTGVTELIHAEHDPAALEQELTAVHPRARGRGLARLLKARLLLDLRERYPDARYVTTYNAASNDSMWGINAAMGFERHREEIGYQLPLDSLQQLLASR